MPLNFFSEQQTTLLGPFSWKFIGTSDRGKYFIVDSRGDQAGSCDTPAEAMRMVRTLSSLQR